MLIENAQIHRTYSAGKYPKEDTLNTRKPLLPQRETSENNFFKNLFTVFSLEKSLSVEKHKRRPCKFGKWFFQAKIFFKKVMGVPFEQMFFQKNP